MKYFFVLIIFCLISCKTEEKKDSLYTKPAETIEGGANELSPSAKLGQEIFDGKGNCFACHKPDQKIIGPSIAEIAKIYKEKNGDIAEFLKGKGEPIVDPSQYEVMKTNFSITKNLSDEELKGLEDYIYSFESQSQ
jgi:cytochrome c